MYIRYNGRFFPFQFQQVSNSERLDSDQQTISDIILELGLVRKYLRWMPREKSQMNLIDCVITCAFLTTQNKIEDRMMAEDEKWITYEIIVRNSAYCEPDKHAPPSLNPSLA
ncbi:HTH_48 domain-containing protein [Trichonephila clavipes]|nr:HTH_48 domain-containing protein [Trichonephila clavipes]